MVFMGRCHMVEIRCQGLTQYQMRGGRDFEKYYGICLRYKKMEGCCS